MKRKDKKVNGIDMLILLTFYLIYFFSPVYAGEWHIDQDHENNIVLFTSEIIGFSFQGKTNEIDGFIYDADNNILKAGADFLFEVNLTDLSSGIGKRDRDMREILNTHRWPKATFTGRLNNVHQDSLMKDFYVTNSKGILSLRGKEKIITVKTRIKQQHKHTLRIDAHFSIKLSDYNIEAPKLASFIKVSEHIKVQVGFVMKLATGIPGS
ncbi:MAG: YceI family protein [Candidatus Latescibacterota bacterium]|nr:YceI family protein [Candidatus Latescibacterota bacterium]